MAAEPLPPLPLREVFIMDRQTARAALTVFHSRSCEAGEGVFFEGEIKWVSMRRLFDRLHSSTYRFDKRIWFCDFSAGIQAETAKFEARLYGDTWWVRAREQSAPVDVAARAFMRLNLPGALN